jgi:hypothetical protein
MEPDLRIRTSADWDKFTNFNPGGGLDSIVDPMIYRTADVFLRGQRGVSETLESTEQVWKSIKRNVDSLMIFFDLLILSKSLPIIDYGITFEQTVGVNSDDIIKKCNQHEKLLISVHVSDDASKECRDAAFETLKNRPLVPKTLADELREEMKALEYKWTPNLYPLGFIPDDDLPVTRFLYGAALFGAFAQMAGVGHVFQPKRSRAFLAASLHADADLAQDEERLYRKLAEIMGKRLDSTDCSAELAGLPPFLPYLLSKEPKCSADLLAEALTLRKTGMIGDYRDWRSGLIRDWREKGVIRAQYRKELAIIATKVNKELSTPAASNVELKVSMTGLGPSWKVPVDQIWGWICSQLPGRRYMKILTRLALAQAEYEDYSKHIRTVWVSE